MHDQRHECASSDDELLDGCSEDMEAPDHDDTEHVSNGLAEDIKVPFISVHHLLLASLAEKPAKWPLLRKSAPLQCSTQLQSSVI